MQAGGKWESQDAEKMEADVLLWIGSVWLSFLPSDGNEALLILNLTPKTGESIYSMTEIDNLKFFPIGYLYVQYKKVGVRV